METISIDPACEYIPLCDYIKLHLGKTPDYEYIISYGVIMSMGD